MEAAKGPEADVPVRVVIHSGDVETGNVAELYKQYAASR